MAYEDNAFENKFGRFILIGTIHGAFTDCSNDIPGIYVQVDDLSVLGFIQKEVFGSVCDTRGTINGTLSLAKDKTLETPKLDDDKCMCKDFVSGEHCNECSPGFWNLTQSNPLGCQSKSFCNLNKKS